MFFLQIIKFINRLLKKDTKLLVFIPHGGIYKDSYSLWKYTSDNALAFMKYMIDSYGAEYKYCVAVDYREYDGYDERLRKSYPDNIEITSFPFFLDGIESRILKRKLYYQNIFKVLCRASYIFTSETPSLYYKTKKQTVVYLGYYVPFKNDYLPINAGITMNINASKSYDYCITTSLLSSQIISHTYNIPLYKFRHLGFSRNDALLKIKRNTSLEKFIYQSVDYQVRKVFLYTPTHRDYEQNRHCSARNILGFDFDKERLSTFLKQNNAIIICKVHSRQNTEALRKELPVGVVLHIPNQNYGLCELMQYSDCLITDYTSAYFDYLLLDRPVLFNFYDFDKYKEYRGFSYDPIDSILAGEVFVDEASFYDKMTIALCTDTYQQKRSFVKDMVYKYKDSHSSERIYDLVFKKQTVI